MSKPHMRVVRERQFCGDIGKLLEGEQAGHALVVKEPARPVVVWTGNPGAKAGAECYRWMAGINERGARGWYGRPGRVIAFKLPRTAPGPDVNVQATAAIPIVTSNLP